MKRANSSGKKLFKLVVGILQYIKSTASCKGWFGDGSPFDRVPPLTRKFQIASDALLTGSGIGRLRINDYDDLPDEDRAKICDAVQTLDELYDILFDKYDEVANFLFSKRNVECVPFEAGEEEKAVTVADILERAVHLLATLRLTFIEHFGVYDYSIFEDKRPRLEY